MTSLVNYTKHSKKSKSLFHKCFQKVEGRISNSFYEDSLTLIDFLENKKKITSQENYRPISHIDTKILNKILVSCIQ